MMPTPNAVEYARATSERLMLPHHRHHPTITASLPLAALDPNSVTPAGGGDASPHPHQGDLERDLAMEAATRSERDSNFKSVGSGSALGSDDTSSPATSKLRIKTKKKKVRRRLLKTPATAAIATAAVVTATRKTPPSLGDEQVESARGAGLIERAPFGAAFAGGSALPAPGAAPHAAATAPTIPSPPSSSGPSGPRSAGAGGGGGSTQLLRPRPAPAPPTRPPSLFPPPSRRIDQSTLRQDDPRFWSYDVGPAAHPRSVNALAQQQWCDSNTIYHGGLQRAEPSSARPWSGEDFDFGRQLGKGKFGIVYSVTEKSTGASMALKVLHKSRVLRCGVAPKLLRREVEIQTRLNHDNIVRLHGYFHDDRSVCLLLQHAPHGDLYQLMSKRADEGVSSGGALPHPVAASFAAQVASALSYLGRHHVSHRDIKPENLLLSGGDGGEPTTFTTVKIADFGWAVHAPPPLHHRRSTLCGTPEYVPPEMIRYEPKSSKRQRSHSVSDGGSSGSTTSSESEAERRDYDARYVDAWALGVLTYEMVRGRTPFFLSQSDQKSIAEEKGYSTAHETVFDLIRGFQPEVHLTRQPEAEGSAREEEDEREFIRLVRALLRDIPERRVSVDSVAFHPWVSRNMAGSVGPSKKRVGTAASINGTGQRQIKKVKASA